MPSTVEILLLAQDMASGVFGNVGKAIGGVGTVIAGVAVKGIGALTDMLGECIAEAQGAQESQAQLANVIRSTGGVAGVTAEMASDLASSLQSVTRFEDDAIISGENMLLTFTNIGKDVFPMATETMLDVAQAMGGDVKNTAIQLGKALNDPVKGISALTRVGVTFTEQQKDQIKAMTEAGNVAGAQKLILEELGREFGGSAKAAGQTMAGQMEIAQHRMADFKETIGNAVIPILGQLSAVAMPLVGGVLQKFSDWFTSDAVQGSIAAFTKSIGDVAGGLSNFFTALLNGEAIAFDSSEEMSRFAEVLSTLGIPEDVAMQISDTIFQIVSAFNMLQADFAAGETGDAIAKFAANIAQAFGMAEEQAYALGDGIGAVVNLFTNQIGIEDFTEAIYDAFGEETGALIVGITGTIKGFIDLFSTGDIEQFGETLSNALGPETADGIITTVTDISNAISATGQVFSDLFTRIGDGKTAITTLVSDFVSGILQIFGASEETGAAIGSTIGDAIGGVINTFSNALAWVEDNWPLIQAAVTSALQGIVAAVQTYVIPFVQSIITTLGQAVAWVVNNWPQISQTITTVFNLIAGVIGPILNSIVSIVTSVLTVISDLWQQHGAGIMEFVQSTFGKIAEVIGGMLQLVAGIVGGALYGVASLVGSILTGIAKFVEDNLSGLKAAFELVFGSIRLVVDVALTAMRGIINTILNVIKGDWKAAWESFKGIVTGIWDAIQTWFNGVPSQMVEMGKRTIEGLIKGLEQNAQQVVASLQKIVNDAIDSVKKFLGIQSPSTVFAGIGANMMRGLAEGITGFGDLPTVELRGVASASMGAIQPALATAGGGLSLGASTGGPATVNVYLDGRLIETTMGNILYGSRQTVYGGRG